MRGGASACFLIFLGSLAGCDRSNEEIKVYRLAKPAGQTPSESDAIASTKTSQTSINEPASSAANIYIPPNWESQPLSQMRQASFLVRGENETVADISFVTLGPAAGTALDNVNRWLNQLSQPPITAEKLASTVQKLPTARGDVDVVDLSGSPEGGDAKKDGRILSAIASEQDKTSFFKMRGNPALVSAEKENFLKWVVAMCNGSGQSETAPQSVATTEEKIQIKWDVPPGWSTNPASGMRYASFTVDSQNEGKVDISVITFPGDGGDDLGNINRWREQIGLKPVDNKDSNIGQLKSNDIAFSTVDLAGSNARTLAAWTRQNGRAWFFKLTGPNGAVEKEKQNFVKFVQSIRF